MKIETIECIESGGRKNYIDALRRIAMIAVEL